MGEYESGSLGGDYDIVEELMVFLFLHKELDFGETYEDIYWTCQGCCREYIGLKPKMVMHGKDTDGEDNYYFICDDACRQGLPELSDDSSTDKEESSNEEKT